jgi:hypothetical protein
MTASQIDEIPEADYIRRLIREPPDLSDVAAHLVWVRAVSHVLVGLEEWVPHFATALLAHHRSLEMFRPYCASGTFERSYIDGEPHVLGFLRHFMGASGAPWLRDVVRCEAWTAVRRGGAPAAHGEMLRQILGVEARQGTEYVIVSHDALETLQNLVGYADATMIRAARSLWYLGVPPIFPSISIRSRPGVVVFTGDGADMAMAYLAAEGL